MRRSRLAAWAFVMLLALVATPAVAAPYEDLRIKP